MSKKRFIQAVVIRSLPELPKLPAAIKYAEDLWEALTRHGYGQPVESKPQAGKDWYRELSERQRKWFSAFWLAFGYKQGRNEAAMRWHQLGDLTDEQYQQIVDAARKEAGKQLAPGQVRKMAQGWLFEKRYMDYAPDERVKQNEKNHVLTHLMNQLNGIKQLHAASGDEALLAQINKLEDQIRQERNTAFKQPDLSTQH
jgi:hypothetical protein